MRALGFCDEAWKQSRRRSYGERPTEFEQRVTWSRPRRRLVSSRRPVSNLFDATVRVGLLARLYKRDHGGRGESSPLASSVYECWFAGGPGWLAWRGVKRISIFAAVSLFQPKKPFDRW